MLHPPPQTYTIYQPVSRPFLRTCTAVSQYITARHVGLEVDFQFAEIIDIEAIYQIQEFLILYHLRKTYNQ